MRRLVVPLAVTLLLAAPSSAGAEILITFIRYNPPGPDTGSNASRNGEYVTIHNNARRARELTGWRLHDNQHHRFTFPTFTLCGGCIVRVHTGDGEDGAHNLYWGSGNYIWNNTGDRATLVKADGVIRDTCAYSPAPAGDKRC
jgi:Lamin Tail Domain